MNTIPKITPHLWYDNVAKEAAKFYTKTFPNSKIKNSSIIYDTPSGNADIITIELMGQEFMMISAGPYFKLNPSISFLVACPTKKEVEDLWKKLSEGGSELMELGEYPFSEKYAWIQDKFGLSWQLIYLKEQPIKQRITPTLMFVGNQSGNAEAAINFYVSLFHNSKVNSILRYTQEEPPEKAGTVKHAEFSLENQAFAAMDSAQEHKFSFNEAISFIVHCENQEEIDFFWNHLSADPAAEQCGWLKDKYGLSWQIVPTAMDRMMSDKDPKKLKRVTEAFLKMKKFDIAKLTEAYNGE